MSAPSRAREVWAMALIGLTSFLLFADQNLMGPNLTQIATEFGLSAVERDQKLGGHVSLGFWIVGGHQRNRMESQRVGKDKGSSGRQPWKKRWVMCSCNLV